MADNRGHGRTMSGSGGEPIDSSIPTDLSTNEVNVSYGCSAFYSRVGVFNSAIAITFLLSRDLYRLPPPKNSSVGLKVEESSNASSCVTME